MKAPKDMRNNLGNYNYRSCESILEAVKPLLAANSLALTLTDEMVQVGDRIYVRATATVTLTSGGESISVDAFAREEEAKKGMDSSQVTGAASSYARKYALNGLFCIDDNKDSDATNTHGKEEKPEKKPDAPQPEAKSANRKEVISTMDRLMQRDGDNEYFICPNCGKPNHAFTKKDGSVMTPREMIGMSMRDFGKPLCKDCYKKALGK